MVDSIDLGYRLMADVRVFQNDAGNECFLIDLMDTAQQKSERNRRRNRLIDVWGAASITDRKHWLEVAVRCEPSSTIAEIIRRQNPLTEKPHVNVLNTVAREKGLPPVFSTT